MAGGRPSSYKPEFVEQAKKLCALGATNADLADFFGVTTQTIDNWMVSKPEFFGAIRMAKDEADSRVVRRLYERATGYSYDAEKIFQFQGEIVRAPYREHVPPSDTAAMFWLKNRRRDEWRDKHDHEVSGEMSLTVLSGVPRADDA